MLTEYIKKLVLLKEKNILSDEAYQIEKRLTVMKYFMNNSYKEESEFIEDLHRYNQILSQEDIELIVDAVKKKNELEQQTVLNNLKAFAQQSDYITFFVLKKQGIDSKDLANFIELEDLSLEEKFRAYAKESDDRKKELLKILLGKYGGVCEKIIVLHQLYKKEYVDILAEYDQDEVAFKNKYSELYLSKEKAKVKTKEVVEEMEPIKEKLVESSKNVMRISKAKGDIIKNKLQIALQKGKEVLRPKFELFKKWIKQPHVIKWMIIGVVILMVMSTGALVYKDSLKYRIPEAAQLQSLAIQQLNINSLEPMDLILESLDKKNRKAYELILTGKQQKDNCEVKYVLRADYTYNQGVWEMSIPEIINTEVVSIVNEIGEEEFIEHLINQVDKELNWGTSDGVKVMNISLNRENEFRGAEGDYVFDVTLEKDLVGYEIKGTVTYVLNTEYNWEPMQGTLEFEITEKGFQQVPKEAQMIEQILKLGVQLEGLGKVYFAEESIKIKGIQLKDLEGQLIATSTVEVNQPYLKGSFEVEIPFSILDGELVAQTQEVILGSNQKIEELLPPTITEEDLKQLFTENNRIEIYSNEEEKMIPYYIQEEGKIKLGNRVQIDFATDPQKVMISYNVEVSTKDHEVKFIMHIPYKEMFEELLAQFRLTNYSDLQILRHPITVDTIRKDMMNKYLTMESEEGVVSRETKEYVNKIEIMNQEQEEDKLIFRVMASFDIEEDNGVKKYVGEYNISYRENLFDYSLINIEFIN